MSVNDDLDYSGFFKQQDAVDEYLQLYTDDSTGSDRLAWEVQRPYLSELLGRLAREHGARVAMDYACGGGRILAEFPAEFTEIHGWDSSAAMLERCAETVPRASLRQVDLADGDASRTDITFDVVTTFRLLLNLEPERRAAVARRLHDVLRPGGFLVFDNHGNRRSLRHLAVRVGGRRHRFANELSDSEVRGLMTAAGFRVVSQDGFGWIPEAAHRNRVLRPVARAVDGFLLRHTRTPLLAIRHVYVMVRD